MSDAPGAILVRAEGDASDGATVWIKDCIATRDMDTTAGSEMLRGHRPSMDATVVRRLRDAGWHVAGKVALDEFAMGTSGRDCAFGPVENPAAPGRVIGGSSSGSAAVVAAGLGAALGTDTGGSVRLPAAFSGVVGLRPTWGRVSRYGVIAMASSMDTVGPIAGDVAGVSALLAAIAGADANDPRCGGPAFADPPQLPSAEGISLGVLDADRTRPDQPHGRAADPVDRATSALRRLGASATRLPAPDRRTQLDAYGVLANAEAASNIARYDAFLHGPIEHHPDVEWEAARNHARTLRLGPGVQRRILFGTWALGRPDVLDAARAVRAATRAAYRALLDTYDVLVEPAVTIGPPPIAEADNPDFVGDLDLYFVGASLADLPAMVVPMGADADGLPLAVHLTAAPFQEEKLLQVAALIEASR